jgi:RHS repeat-associated protein
MFLMQQVAMAQEPYIQTITGKIKANDSCRTTDPVYLDNDAWSKRETDLSVKDVITFELRQDTGIYYYKKPFSCVLNFDLHYEDEQHGSHDLTNLQLKVSFDTTPGSIYKGVAMYKFSGGYSVRVKVNSIASPELGGQDSLPAVFRIKDEIFIERKFHFTVANSDITRYSLLNEGKQVKINWMVNYDYPGAEFYDLEWTFYDDSSSVVKNIRSMYTADQINSGIFNIAPSSLENYFKNNSTRITTTDKEYLLNLPYPAGFLFYRVRGARMNGFTGEREEGDWSYKAYTADNTESNSIVLLINDHASTLSYQYTAKFAEEGKRNEVIGYYDGSLRERQIVSLNNTSNRAVVKETIYDAMGRPSLTMMDSPEPDSTLHYFPGFTRNSQGDIYTYKDFSNDTCYVTPLPVSNLTGAGRYYSSNNPHSNSLFRDYTPDAGGYPFYLTTYTPDNMGRIREKGGTGLDYQPGHGHTKRYFYTNPDELELDRLFGSEAGNSSHYLKNLLLDANGQISVTYLDANGKTIATALAGPKPDNVYELPDAAGTIVNVTKKLAKPENTVRNASDFTITSSTSLAIPMAGIYHFDYSFDPQSVTTASCEDNPVDICADCYYDLQIMIQDECGISLYTVTKPAVLTDIDTLCTTKAPLISGTFDVTLPIGEYQVTYQLIASKMAAEYYDSAYQRQNTCISTLDDFKRKFLAQADFSGCYSDCESCKTALGSRDVFTNRYLQMLKDEDLYPNDNDVVFASQLYDSLYTSCTQRCTAFSTNSCQDTYELLLMDVSPGGQYALYNYDALEDASLTVLQEDTVNVLRFYNQVTDYLDEDGNPAMVQNEAGEMVVPQALNIREFIQNFSPSWSASLIKYHPEYCFYKWCSIISTSKDLDERLNYVDDAGVAADSGWWNRADPLALLKKDPFFATGGAGSARYTAMKNVLEHFSKTIQTNMQGGDANILQVIKYLVYCSKDSTITSFAACNGPVDCNGGLDVHLEWLLYRNFYLTEKVKQVTLSRQASTDPVIRNCKNCYIGYAMGECDPLTDPDCSTYQQAVNVMQVCKDYYGNNDPRKALYAAKTRQYMDDVNGEGITTQLSSKTMQELKDSLDQQLNTQLLNTCQSNCEAQADNWMASLQYCENLINGTDSTKYKQLRAGLIDVCKNGCDATHPYGASTIAPGKTNTDNNFEAVIIRVLGAAAVKDSCTALLISSPLPYLAQDTSITTSQAFDACTCENLQSLQAEYEQRGGAGGFLAFLKKKFGTGFYLTQNDLNILLNKCGGDECVTASQLPEALPDALRCKTCISCDSLNTLVNTFNTAHPSLAVGTSIYETSISNYLNQTLRFSLTYAEYWDFMHRCSAVDQESNADNISCVDFTKAYKHFQQFKPDYYSNPNGDTGLAARFQQQMTTWLNIELSRNLSYTAYRAAAARCGITITEPHDSMPLVCDVPLTPGDSVFGCPPSVANCCTMDGYIQTFKNAYPAGVNARLVAYYFEMKRHQWCAPVGLPTMSFRETYTNLKNYFISTLKFPKSSIIDITASGTTINIESGKDCGLDYHFGPVAPLVDNEVYRLCNHSPVMMVELDSLSCFRSQFKMALINAGLSYQEYMDSIRHEYQEIYLSRCMSVQPKLNMKGDLYEYHYTLYYYDQSGDMVKTVPPAGVHLLTDAQIAQVEHDRPYNKPECYEISDTLRFNGGGYIPMNTLLTNRLSISYGLEEWISVSNYTASQALFSEEVKVTAPEKYIDSTRTIPAFTGTKGVSCYIKNNKLWLRIGSQPANFPDTLFQTLSGVSTLSLSSLIPAGKWAHIVVNGTGSSSQPFQVYVNGKAVGFSFSRRVDTLGARPTPAGTPEFRLGAALIDNNWSYYSGYMKQFRFYNRVLGYPEVVLNRDNICGIPASNGGLLIWTPMNEGRDTSVLGDLIQNIKMQTANPAGFSWMRHHNPFYPQHTLVSTYAYNSLDAIIQKYTPDQDTTRFWYDRLGRLFASRHAEQFHPLNGGAAERYGYSKYDSLDRITEVGEKTGSQIATVNPLHDTEVQQWLTTGSNTQISRTQYDEPLSGLDIVQTNLNKRVASTTLDEDGDGIYESAIHYTYDISGYTKTLWQEIKAMEQASTGQGLKRIDYYYDLLNGKVNKIAYQSGRKDQFYYRQLYDADNRVIEAGSSRDGLIWQSDARYSYYLHGPLGRIELGQYQVQGIDYAYNLQGRMKGINASTLNPEMDMAGDGKAGSHFDNFGRDIMAFTLGYHANDYIPVGSSATQTFDNKYVYPTVLGIGNELYNGNISTTSLSLNKLDNGALKGAGYAYDQLNRLVQTKQHNVSSNWSVVDDYRENIVYDANGNILSYLRNGTTKNGKSLEMDKLTYSYTPATNRLRHIKDSVVTQNYVEDIDDQTDDNYSYDRIGNLIKDKASNIDSIKWTVYGKIRQVVGDTLNVRYHYDALGNRILKDVNGRKKFYFRDANGDILATYTLSGNTLNWDEQGLYSSTRLGIWKPNVTELSGDAQDGQDSILRGTRIYELSNHLGNVMATISDKKTGISEDTRKVDYYMAEVLTEQDYYPIGMQQPERTYSLKDDYHYGFNGKENDDELKGRGTQQDYGERTYDTRVGRFLSVDPIASKYAMLSPYQFASNNPVQFVDLDGLEGGIFSFSGAIQWGGRISIPRLGGMYAPPPTVPLPPLVLPQSPTVPAGPVSGLRAPEGMKIDLSEPGVISIPEANIEYTLGKGDYRYAAKNGGYKPQPYDDDLAYGEEQAYEGENKVKVPAKDLKNGKPKSDAPDWAKEYRPRVGEKGENFAKRLMDRKYGKGNYPKGAGTENSQIHKWADQHFKTVIPLAPAEFKRIMDASVEYNKEVDEWMKEAAEYLLEKPVELLDSPKKSVIQ